TITDNDPTPTVQFSSTGFSVNESSSYATLTVTLSSGSGEDVTFYWTCASGTASAGSDFYLDSDTVTFSPGQTSKTIVVPIIADDTDEYNETFLVELVSSSTTLGSPSTATVTILDDDAPPTVGVSGSSVQVSEGNGNASVTVTLSAATETTVTVYYSTASGSATGGTDYTSASGASITLTPSQTAKAIVIPLNADSVYEANETFSVTVTSATNATLDTDHDDAVLTILDDDPPLNELPADQTIDEDVTLVLSGTKKIQVDNSGTTTKPIDVTLTVSHGTLSQSSFSGSVASVNTALASVTYTPDANYNGEDELVVTTTDDANGSLSDTDTLTITITPVNDAPDAVDDEFETDEDTELHITDSQLLSNDSDVDGDTISVIGTVTPPSHGSVSYDAVNEYWVYTPDPDYTGP